MSPSSAPMRSQDVPSPNARFPTTQWSVILAGKEDGPARKEALKSLCNSYWQPLYCYARKRGLSKADAEDAIQTFLASLLERHGTIANLDPNRGKLRSFLKASLGNFLANDYAKRTAQKRGGGAPVFTLDFDVAESSLSSVPDNPEVAYDRAWAQRLVTICLERLVAEYESGARSGPATVLRELFGFGLMPSQAEIAEQHDMSVSQVKAFVHRARKRFRNLVLDEVANTVGSPPEVNDEVRRLFALLH